MDTYTQPSLSKTLQQTNMVTTARGETTGLVRLKHIHDSLKRHKECQNHMNILLLSLPVIKDTTAFPYTQNTALIASISHCDGEIFTPRYPLEIKTE